MIEKKISLKVKKDLLLDYSYNGDVTRGIYQAITRVNKEKSDFLHNEGYGDQKKFKLFNYCLLFKGAKFEKEGIRVSKDTEINLILKGKEEIVGLVSAGLMLLGEMNISKEPLYVVSIENGRIPPSHQVVLYKTLSPILSSTEREDGKPQYLDCSDLKFFENIGVNAKRKYKEIYGKKYEGDIFFDVDDYLNVREKKIRIKDGFLRGYEMEIWVEATPPMQKVIYHLGLGEKSSMGFGCMSVITSRRD